MPYYERKRLIEYKAPFIVPGNQLHLPGLGIDLREYFRSPVRKTVWVREPIQAESFVRLAGLSALSRYSMLDEPGQPVYAMSRTAWSTWMSYRMKSIDAGGNEIRQSGETGRLRPTGRGALTPVRFDEAYGLANGRHL